MEEKTPDTLTDTEKRVLRRLRALVQFGFGDLNVKVQDHKIMQINAEEKERVG